ncbi:MAG: tRNA lysidine(34) synthetase TilS [Oscillospiraceae bacterium]|nr:tRNA lysidine(34) synthetase TilS [Oscillospiraceae bacterium]
MVTKVFDTIRKFNIEKDAKILVALSGGVDSSVMLDVLLRIKDELSVSVCAAHLNHMLRGEDADSDEAFVREKCKKYGIEFLSERIDVMSLSEETGQSTELAARNARYDFLSRAKREMRATHIATAHNANDNLETILFNLTRGGGLRGLCGIPPVRDDIIRPLIGCTRKEIEEYAKMQGVSFCTDKTNDETEYSRNKLRHFVVPTLLELNPAAVENAARTSEILRADCAFMSDAAATYANKISTSATSCRRDGLTGEKALASRVCDFFAAKALGKETFSLEYKHVQMILMLAGGNSPSGKLNLPGGLVVRRSYEEIIFEKETVASENIPLSLSEGESLWGDYVISVKKSEKSQKIHNLLNTFFVPYDKIQGNLQIRPRKEGDEIKLPKRRTKSIKKLFVDEKLPRPERDKVPVIADDEKVFAVLGFGGDERFSAGSGGGYFIEINRK